MNRYDLNGIVRQYGARTVLRIEQLAIRAGQTTALLGPSGAGKSTLLRILGFLEPPDRGELRFNGQPIPHGAPPLSLRRSVTMVFQRPLLLDTSVWGNVVYGLWLRGRREREQVEQVLERVGVSHLARAHASTLSGGEAQRVALARALVLAPQVLLLDEPTANLDPANVELIEGIIRELNGGRTTIVIVTHNLFQARRLAGDAVLLIDGQLVESGPLPDLFDRPRDPRTAAFCGGTMVW